MPEENVYRVWYELAPLPGWYWWLSRHWLTWPPQGMWLRKAERGAVRVVELRKWVLIGDPIAVVHYRNGHVVVGASVLAHGPKDATVADDPAPVDIVDREDG